MLDDHDLHAELALVSLGASPCECLQVMKMWRDQWKMPPELFRQMQSWLGAKAFLAPPELSHPRSLAMAVNWERAWRHSLHNSKHGHLLESELRNRALELLRGQAHAWAERAAPLNDATAEVRLAPPGRPVGLTGAVRDTTLVVVATLDVRWLLDVWSRGLAVVDDAFVLEVCSELRSGALRCRALRWARGSPGTPAVEYRLVDQWEHLGRRGDGTWALGGGNQPAACDQQ